jgi:hypothetical protein
VEKARRLTSAFRGASRLNFRSNSTENTAF